MKGTISSGLQILASGLAPYVDEMLCRSLGDDWQRDPRVTQVINSADPKQWDAQVVLVLMWDHWNQVFRHDLGFVERSLVSELREFRNRWAHQKQVSLRDVYRCIDSIERLLRSTNCDAAEQADELRRETLKLLHDDELVEASVSAGDWFTACVTTICGSLIVVVVLEYLRQPLSWVLAGLTAIVFTRFVFRITRQRMVVNTGPRQCGGCARVYYGSVCPYCQPVSVSPTPPPSIVSRAE
ncbi:MAG: Swt1 family HEPN domain-containing protein [Fuerstiella sp.]|nr:Swt1 family HEPN domain-containing protein [Fuerstiella sp.]